MMGKSKTRKNTRFYTAAFFIAFEFAQLIAVFILLNRFSIIMTVLSYIFNACVILYVINREEIPELKLPWLILFLVLPIVGAFIFIIFNGSEHKKTIIKEFNHSNDMLIPYRRQNYPNMQTLQEENMDAFLQANYLCRVTDMPSYDRSRVTYYPIGEDFHAALLDSLDKAERFIFMEYFMIEQGAMWNSIHEILVRKSKQGVQVNIMYDDLGCMKTLPQHYHKELTGEGIQCIPFNRFRPIISEIHNNRDHRKITVIDGTTGFTGGVNLMDEYINAKDKLGHWKDSAVKIEGEAVKSLTMIFLSVWNMQSQTKLPYEPYLYVDYPEYENAGTVIPYGDGPKFIYRDSIGRDVYMNMINSAKRYVYITTPYLICDSAMLGAIRTAAKKGVDVRIIMPGIPDKKLVFLMSRSNYGPLIRDGVKIYEYTPGFVHAKNFVCDDMFAVCGTINLDYRSLVHHYECGCWLYNMDAVHDMKADFVDTMGKSELVTAEKAKLNRLQKIVVNVLKIFFPLL